MKNIAILGASGNIGSEAVTAFCNAGWNVRALTRSGSHAFPSGVNQIKVDVMDRDALIAATQDCEFILNAINPSYTDWQKFCLPIATNVIEAARSNGAIHLFPANVYNYGTTIPPIITDQTPPAPDTVKGGIRQEMEDLFRQYAEQHEVQTLILRAGDFFGGKPSNTNWFDLAIAKSVARGKLQYPGDPNLVHSWAYLPDLAQAFVQLAEQAEKLQKFEDILFRGHALNGHQLKAVIEKTLGKSTKFSSFPWWLINLTSPFVGLMKEVREMSYLWKRSHEMDANSMKSVLPRFKDTPIEAAIADSLSRRGVK